MTAEQAITRPALRYHGGKWRIAPWIIKHFPPHRVYVEPFGGGGSVLLRKPRSYAEIYNDLDSEVVGLFRVLRDPGQAAALRRALELTPFARDEFQSAYGVAQDPVEAARLLVVRSFMGFGSDGFNREIRTGFRANANRSGTTPAHDWRNLPPNVSALADRLAGVVIENRPAIEVMAQQDGNQTLHYVDPPYVTSTRSERGQRGAYRHEMTDADHVVLADALKGMAGMVVLSGYRCALYDGLYAGWARVDIKARADGAKPRTECLWLNQAAASRVEQGQLFEGATP